jgi:hypothetical protein
MRNSFAARLSDKVGPGTPGTEVWLDGSGEVTSACFSIAVILDAVMDWRWVMVRIMMSQCWVNESILSSRSRE